MASDSMPDLSVPVQILSLEHLAQSGIYFLSRAGKVVYVGQAVDMRRRIGQHIAEGTKAFDAVSGLACNLADLNAEERRYIVRLLPEYNRCSVSQQLRNEFGEALRNEGQAPIVGEWLSAEEAATFLGVNLSALKTWREAGVLVPCRVPRRPSRKYPIKQLRSFAVAYPELIREAA